MSPLTREKLALIAITTILHAACRLPLPEQPSLHTQPKIGIQPPQGEAAPLVLFQRKFDFNRDSDPRVLDQLNPMLAGDPILEEVRRGQRIIASGKGEHVRRIQNALIFVGYELPVHGSDAQWGRETSTAVREFQSDSQLPTTGEVDQDTLLRLDRKANSSSEPVEKYPDYKELFADGILEITIGVGYDEDDYFFHEVEKMKEYFTTREFLQINENKAEELWRQNKINPPLRKGGDYYLRSQDILFSGNDVKVLIRLVTFLRDRGSNTFIEAMQRSDISIYVGHGRWGSGADFFRKDSKAGKVWINPELTLQDPKAKKMYDFLRKQKVERPLSLYEFNDKYKLWFFNGCNTAHYMNPIRMIYGISHQKTDVIGWNQSIYIDKYGEDVIEFLKEILNRHSLQSIAAKLNELNEIENARRGLRGEGFGDNPEKQP